MRNGEVFLEIGILSIVNILVVHATKVASQMLPMQVVKEFSIIEEEFVAKVTERMR